MNAFYSFIAQTKLGPLITACTRSSAYYITCQSSEEDPPPALHMASKKVGCLRLTIAAKLNLPLTKLR